MSHRQMSITQKLDMALEMLAEIIIILIGKAPTPKRQILVAFGQGKVDITMLQISPGQKKTLTVAFTDNATPPVAHPLGSLPTASDSTGGSDVAVNGSPTLTDPTYAFDVTCHADVAVGSQLQLVVSGTNPDGVVDTQTFPVDVIALDDTQVSVVSFQ